MEVRYLPDPVRYKTLGTPELRSNFLIEELFVPGSVRLVYCSVDRTIVGSAVPTLKPLQLEGGSELASEYFAERREIGVINIGEPGTIRVDEKEYELGHSDFLYISRGSREIEFTSKVINTPAYFYLLSYPAHKEYPTTHATLSDIEAANLGSMEESNKRNLYKVIHPGGIKSCQLVMGLTILEEGSIWNTMSAHTHERRSEVYMYFDIPDDSVVFHFMGLPEETRHIVVRNRQAVLSPSWSIHAGAGTRNYKFVWGMGGENQEFADMDSVAMDKIS